MPRCRHNLLIAAAITAVVLRGALGSAADAVATSAPHASFLSVAPPTGTLDAAGRRRLAGIHWQRYRAAAAAPTIRVSPTYANPAAIATRWSSFFGSLLHASELGALDAYIAPIEEVRTICGSSDVLGCYGANHLVTPDQEVEGVAATSIATHEYGHHVAYNRVSPPWVAVDWGPKRWATYERVCPRVAAGTAFPGAEDGDYSLNPGEGWAETYRVLNETAAGLPPTWPIIDPSFRPDAGALEGARQDVLDPWTAPAVTTKRVAFAGGARTWTLRVATPLDGSLHVQVEPGSDDVTLLAADTRAVLSRGAWSSSGAKTFDYVVCGQRSLVLRVTRHSPARRFTLRMTIP
jgi:hypothetical protein